MNDTLIAACVAAGDAYTDATTESRRAEAALREVLTPEQIALLNTASDAQTVASAAFTDLMLAEIARHLDDTRVIGLDDHVRTVAANAPGACCQMAPPTRDSKP